jgi:hypothetical protein
MFYVMLCYSIIALPSLERRLSTARIAAGSAATGLNGAAATPTIRPIASSLSSAPNVPPSPITVRPANHEPALHSEFEEPETPLNIRDNDEPPAPSGDDDATPQQRKRSKKDKGNDNNDTKSSNNSMAPPAARLPVKHELKLGQFLATHTSEDNDSFGDLQEKRRKEIEAKYWWVKEQDKQNALDLVKSVSPDQFPGSTGLLKSWAWTSRNALIFEPDVPEEVARKHELEMKTQKGAKKEIIYENTRFPGGFFDAAPEDVCSLIISFSFASEMPSFVCLIIHVTIGLLYRKKQ